MASTSEISETIHVHISPIPSMGTAPPKRFSHLIRPLPQPEVREIDKGDFTMLYVGSTPEESEESEDEGRKTPPPSGNTRVDQARIVPRSPRNRVRQIPTRIYFLAIACFAIFTFFVMQSSLMRHISQP